MNRRMLLALSLGTTTSALSGCFTYQLHKDPSYTENIVGVLVSSDKSTVVVIGKRYHYIFSAPPQLLAALGPSLHQAIAYAGFNSFKVDRQNNIEGKLILQTSEKLSMEQVSLAREAGFNLSSGKLWYTQLAMHGTRYTSKPIDSPSLQQLNKEYSLTITEEPSIARTALNVAATPISVAADGAVVIGAVVLSPLWLPIVASGPCFFCAK